MNGIFLIRNWAKKEFQLFASIVLSTAILWACYGISQLFPWSISATQISISGKSLGISVVLGVLLKLTYFLTLKIRLFVILLAGAMGALASYDQFSSWWGLPVSYIFGAGMNLILGWAIAAWVCAKYIITPMKSII